MPLTAPVTPVKTGTVAIPNAPPASKRARVAPLGREDSNVTATSAGGRTRSAIYHFYELVPLNRYGVPGDNGDKHYKCLHGSGRVITVKRSQKHSVNGTVSGV
ncbi:hypothetical protein C8R46DRAFT_1210612 [Mycena filopes]|nr:hypothetical protein C8R46DRAFT_1210612 [Mycena filopes]